MQLHWIEQLASRLATLSMSAFPRRSLISAKIPVKIVDPSRALMERSVHSPRVVGEVMKRAGVAHTMGRPLLFLCVLLVGCVSADNEFGHSLFPITASPAEEMAILEVANTSSFEVLDDDVGLDRRAAQNIVDRRESGFSTIEQLDAVPYVGDRALIKLLNFTSIDAGEEPEETEFFVHGIAEGSSTAIAILNTANTASQVTLDDEVGLDRRAARNIVADRDTGFTSLVELDKVSYVGASAFARLEAYSDVPLGEVNCHGSAQQVTFTPAGSSIWPHAAWNGHQYGMVWEERDFFRNPVSREILFTLLNAKGEAVGQPIELTSNLSADSTTPRIAWGESAQAFGIVWEDNRRGDTDVHFLRVNSNGEVIGDELVIATNTGRTNEAALTPIHLVFAEDQWSIVWEAQGNSKEVFFQRVLADGSAPDSPTQISGDPNSDSASPQIAWNGDAHLVVWSDSRHHGGDREIYAVPVSKDGTVGEEQRITNAFGNSWSPQVVWDGEEYAVVWADNRTVVGSLGVVDFVQVDKDGLVVEGSQQTLGDGTTESFLPSIAWSGTSYQIVWNDVNPANTPVTDEIVFAVLDADGTTIVDKTIIGIVGTGASGYETVLWNGAEFMMTYYDGSIGNNDIYTSRTDSLGRCL